RASGAAVLRARDQSGLAPRPGEVRLPMDRRRPVPHPLARLVRAGRPFPARTRHLDRAQELGSGEAGGVRQDGAGTLCRPGSMILAVDLFRNDPPMPPPPSPARSATPP